MHITINEGPNEKISFMRGQQLKLDNKGDTISLKVSTPTNDTYTGELHLTLAEIDWLIRTLPSVRNATKGVSIFLDKRPTNSLTTLDLKPLFARLFPA